MNIDERTVDFIMKKIFSFISKKMNQKKWESLFIETGKFLTLSKENKDRFDKELAIAFSENNLKDIAMELYNKPGYYFYDVLFNKLNSLLDLYELNKKEKSYFVHQFINKILSYIEENDRTTYQEFFLGELKKNVDLRLESVIYKIDSIIEKIDDLYEKDILTIYDIELDLFNKSIDGKLKLEYFKIDDQNFIRKLDHKIQNKENIRIIGKSKEETLYLILNELNKYRKDFKIYIIKSLKSWEKLRSGNISECILIPYFNESEIYSIKGNINIFLYDEEETSINEDKLFLRKRLKSNIIKFLENCGFSTIKANEIFDYTNGLYVPIKNYLFDMRKINKYNVSKEHIKYIIIAILLNQWEEIEGDKQLILKLCGCNYNEFIDIIDYYISGENPIFVKKRDSINQYRLASLYDCWEEFGCKISDNTWLKFFDAIKDIYNDVDPSIEYYLTNNFGASFNAPKPKHSECLKLGILKSLLMKKYYIQENDNIILYKIKQFIEEMLLKINSIEQFADISVYINDICEIEPDSFLKFMLKSLENTNFIQLCELKSDVIFDKHYYVKYLWAIDKLLFIKDYQLEAIDLLFKFDSKKISYSISNSPKERLLDIFSAWINVIPIKLEDKLIISEQMIKKYNNAWNIFAECLPNSRNHITLSINKPLYIRIDDFESYQIKNAWDFYIKYYMLCLENCNDCDKLLILISKMKYYSQEIKDELFNVFNNVLVNMCDKDKSKIKVEIKRIIYDSRFHKDAHWSLSEEVLSIYEKLHDSVKVINEIYEYEYFFKRNSEFPILNPIPFKEDNWMEENERLREEEIKCKLNEFIEKNYDIIKLIKLCNFENSNLGWYIADFFDKGQYNQDTLNMLVDISPEINLADYVRYFKLKDFTIFTNIVNELVEKKISSQIIADILDNGFLNKETYNVLMSLPEEVKNIYWKKHLVIDSKSSVEEIELFINEGLKYGTFQSCIQLIYRVKDKLNPNEVYDYILKIQELLNVYNRGTIDDYCLEEVLKKVQFYVINSDDFNKILKIAQFEILVYKVIGYGNMRCYSYLIKLDPRLYADLISFVFKSDEGKSRNTEIGEKLFGLYLDTKFCPAEKNGTVNYDELYTWIYDFKRILSNQKQNKLFKTLIGMLFAFSPPGQDGNMPCEAVRQIIETEFDKELMVSYIVAEKNKRGVFCPNAGAEEHEIALKYKKNADNIKGNYPNTASIYKELYNEYERDSLLERKRAEDEF